MHAKASETSAVGFGSMHCTLQEYRIVSTARTKLFIAMWQPRYKKKPTTPVMPLAGLNGERLLVKRMKQLRRHNHCGVSKRLVSTDVCTCVPAGGFDMKPAQCGRT